MHAATPPPRACAPTTHVNLTLATDLVRVDAALPPRCLRLFRAAPHGVPTGTATLPSVAEMRGCLTELSADDTCAEVPDACLWHDGDGLVLESASPGLLLASPQRDHSIRAEAERERLRMPSARYSERCAVLHAAHRAPLRNATLIGPVWPSNFAETVLGSMLPLLARRPTQELLLGIGPALNFSKVERFWTELLGLTWPRAVLTVPTAGAAPRLLSHLSACELPPALALDTTAFRPGPA